MIVRLLALALFAAFLAVSLPLALGRSARRIERAALYAGESALDERARSFGEPYALAVEEIRRAIPRDGVYAMVNGDAADQGGPIWVRFDLAPRRAILLGRLADLKDPRPVRRKIRGTPDVRWVVVAYAWKPPELIERSRFLRRLEARRGADE